MTTKLSARQDILQRVSKGVAKADFAVRRAAALASLDAPQRGPQPVLSGDLVTRFQLKAESLASTVDRIGASNSVPLAVSTYLDQGGLGTELVITPNLAQFDWLASGLSTRAGAAVDTDQVGVTGCFCAIAETGTLLLISGENTPATVSLLPETHIALVPVSRIVATMEDAFDLLRAELGSIPRAINFISGPSRTGDIEQTIVLGAHGPCRVHLILMEDAE